MREKIVWGIAALSVAIASCGSSDAKECVVEPGHVCRVAGTGIAGFSGDEGQALEADIYLPMDATRGPDGLLYFIDWNNHRIRSIDAEGVIHTIAGSGQLGDGPVGPALQSDFNHPTGLAFDKLGRMVIAAWHNSRIKRLDLTTGLLEDVCGTGKRAYTGDDGPAEVADLDLPASVAFGPDDSLFLMDQANQIIRRIDGAGIITRYAGQCITGMCAKEELPVACAGSAKLACLETDPMGCAKPCSPSYGGDDGPALEARLAQPFGQAADPAGRLVFDAKGNLFFADTSNHRIRRIDTKGVITTVAGTGAAGFAGDGGKAVNAQLNRPVDVDFGADGTLYIADTYNSCVRAVSPEGTIRTVVGVCGEKGNVGDSGTGQEVLLDRPYGLAVDETSRLYVADTYNHRLLVLGL